MKKILASLLVSLALAGIVLSCAVPFDMTKNLKGETLTFTDADGMETIFVFSADGKTGTFEMKVSSYDYATQALATADVYSTKTLVQVFGMKGTFTYDENTRDAVVTLTEQYGPTGTDPYVQAYQPMLTIAKLGDPDLTAVSMTINAKLLFTQDYYYGFSMGEGYGLYTGSGPYVSTQKMSTSMTSGGVISTSEETTTTTLTISATEIKNFTTITMVTKTGTAEAVTDTEMYNYTYRVSKYFELGSTDEGKSFSDIWKEGKIVTFLVDQTREEQIEAVS